MNGLKRLRSATAVRKLLPKLVVDRTFHPSPAAWEDEVLYFLLLDRFSNGRESDFFDNLNHHVQRSGGTPPFDPKESRDVVEQSDPAAGRTWMGGTFYGLAEKLGYLKRLGVTAVWISPAFKQVPGQHTYHGYGIQNFLDVDPNFAPNDLPAPWNDPKEALRTFVAIAHRLGIRVILDIILNHTGDVFAYTGARTDQGATRRIAHFPHFDFQQYDVRGLRDANGKPTLTMGQTHPSAWPDGAVWPEELQGHGSFTCMGEIKNWDWEPEYIHGDFFSLKNLNMGSGDVGNFTPSPALVALTESYKFWIAYADLDGFRIDTVKHIELGATRYFANAIHEFAQRLGKENFYLIGEVTGGREKAFQTVEMTGLDAALGISEIPKRLEELFEGRCDPNDYFRLFRNSENFGKESQTWFNDKVVTMFNEHDMVEREHKARLCAASRYTNDRSRERAALLALSLNVTTLGIPCIYYGSEQCFDGASPPNPDKPGEYLNDDVYLRESMFGGGFGSRGTGNRHFFNEQTWVYRKFKRLLDVRRKCLCLRRGRQYLREISGDGEHFGLPTGYGGTIRSIVAWSRIFDQHEVIVAMNTHLSEARTAWVNIDANLNAPGDHFVCVFDNGDRPAGDDPTILTAVERRAICLSITLEAGGFAIFANEDAISHD